MGLVGVKIVVVGAGVMASLMHVMDLSLQFDPSAHTAHPSREHFSPRPKTFTHFLPPPMPRTGRHSRPMSHLLISVHMSPHLPVETAEVPLTSLVVAGYVAVVVTGRMVEIGRASCRERV